MANDRATTAATPASRSGVGESGSVGQVAVFSTRTRSGLLLGLRLERRRRARSSSACWRDSVRLLLRRTSVSPASRGWPRSGRRAPRSARPGSLDVAPRAWIGVACRSWSGAAHVVLGVGVGGLLGDLGRAAGDADGDDVGVGELDDADLADPVGVGRPRRRLTPWRTAGASDVVDLVARVNCRSSRSSSSAREDRRRRAGEPDLRARAVHRGAQVGQPVDHHEGDAHERGDDQAQRAPHAVESGDVPVHVEPAGGLSAMGCAGLRVWRSRSGG